MTKSHTLLAAATICALFVAPGVSQAAPVLANQSFTYSGLSEVLVYADRFDFLDALFNAGAAPGPIRITSNTSATFPKTPATPVSIADFGMAQVPVKGTGVGFLPRALMFSALPTVNFVAQNINQYGIGSVSGNTNTFSFVYALSGYVYDDANINGVLDTAEVAYSYTQTMSVNFAVSPNTAQANIAGGMGQEGSFSGAVAIANTPLINVPEPASLALCALGLLGIGGTTARRRRGND